jgi:hypothetical protein
MMKIKSVLMVIARIRKGTIGAGVSIEEVEFYKADAEYCIKQAVEASTFLTKYKTEHANKLEISMKGLSDCVSVGSGIVSGLYHEIVQTE